MQNPLRASCIARHLDFPHHRHHRITQEHILQLNLEPIACLLSCLLRSVFFNVEKLHILQDNRWRPSVDSFATSPSTLSVWFQSFVLIGQATWRLRSASWVRTGMLLEFWLMLVLSWNPWKFRYWTTVPDRPWFGWPMRLCRISPIPFEHSNPHSVQIKFECASKILNKFLSWYSQVEVKWHVSNDIIFKRGTLKNFIFKKFTFLGIFLFLNTTWDYEILSALCQSLVKHKTESY